MPIKYIPYLYLFDENKKCIGEQILKIKEEYYETNHDRYGKPLMVCLNLETVTIESRYWLLELVIKMGNLYYYPHFSSLCKNTKIDCIIDGCDHIENITLVNYNFKKLEIKFALKNLVTYCDINKNMLSTPLGIDEIINKHKTLYPNSFYVGVYDNSFPPKSVLCW
ncbi:hypothetical protein crov092 [Cafeteria roenbergensis virus]|uniref:Uncharacterized protein n=1 Tax=Cafeteria roenbergensis virus (strain BV-PW1) TaxID=693272 RepID=E3T4L2_CROVB|nr:hypothetical protein crov092 [Cafeteria roenbergensis virus BV-PW1]ADO67125.1 hypothetical protein crov092 [Cafeteria roenbergensis virus BV-PW1]